MHPRIQAYFPLFSCLLLLATACGGDSHRRPLRVGSEPEGAAGGGSHDPQGQAGSAGGTSVGGNALEAHIEDGSGLAIELVTLGCEDQCADVIAVAHGGNPPYAYAWEDGSTAALRHVCPSSESEYSVTATDTAITDTEFTYEAHTASAAVTAKVITCGAADGGTCEPGPGADTPQAGHYEGTGSYVCDNDSDPGAAMTINKLAVSFDFEIDETAASQPGKIFFQWGLVVIVATGKLDGTFECGGALHSTMVDGVWGLPGSMPMTVLPTGTVSGDFISQRTSDPEAIVGTFQWTSFMADGSYGNTCTGTYEATRKP